jgi:hypothetical protein
MVDIHRSTLHESSIHSSFAARLLFGFLPYFLPFSLQQHHSTDDQLALHHQAAAMLLCNQQGIHVTD